MRKFPNAMGAQKAIRLAGSDKILQWPDDSIEQETLEFILGDAVNKNVDRNRPVIVTHHERVRNFKPDNPDYKDVEYRVPLKELFEMYEAETGQEFTKLSFEEDFSGD